MRLLERFRNNFLALATAGLSFLNSVLYIRAIGISETSDALYFATAVIAAFSLVPGFLTEQFLQYYNDYKHKDPGKAPTFLVFNLVNVLAFGLVYCVAFGFLAEALVGLMYPSLGPGAKLQVAGFLQVLKLELFLVGINGLFQNLAISYGRIKPIYVSRVASSILLLGGQVAIIVRVLPQGAYPYFVILASALVALFMGVENRSLLWGAVKAFGSIDLAFVRAQGRYFVDCLVMRLGHNLQGFFLPLITSSFWSRFSGNLATCYSYGSKFYSAIQSVILGPAQMEAQSSISNDISRGEGHRIRLTIAAYLRTYLPLVALGSCATALVLPLVVHLINPSIDQVSLGIIRTCFAFLAGWLLVQCAEGPFVITIIAKNRGLVFVLANGINIGIIALVITLFPAFFYSILIANILAQLASMTVYVLVARRLLFRMAP